MEIKWSKEWRLSEQKNEDRMTEKNEDQMTERNEDQIKERMKIK